MVRPRLNSDPGARRAAYGRDQRQLMYDSDVARAGSRAAIHEMEVEIFLPVYQRAIRLDLKRINKLPARIRNLEQTLVGRQLDAGLRLDARIHHAFLPVGVNEPDFVIS